jgi:SAM-dependent methyltransferase
VIPYGGRIEKSAMCELQRTYQLRFGESEKYRRRVWKILIRDFFQPLIPLSSHVLDLGCGWGEFINQLDAALKYGMDLNPDSRQKLASNVHFIEQDCSTKWLLDDRSLDVVFSSNFFEHLHTKANLRRTLAEVHRCLKPGGRLICIGPNIKYLPRTYWDFWDHYLPLTERSMREVLELTGFKVERCIPKFLPYRIEGRKRAPLALVRLYLKCPWAWHCFGRQFLVIARR